MSLFTRWRGERRAHAAEQSPGGGESTAPVGPDPGVYAAWVGALRAWAREPAAGLGAVPDLTEDTFDQATFGRLMAHVQSAVAAMMSSWNEEFGAATSRVRTPHELSTEMIRLRRLLVPRVHLARNPAWPEQIRIALWDALVIDLEGMQGDLEKVLSRSSSRGGYDRTVTDRLVEAVRRDPLTAVLRDGAHSPAASMRPSPGRASTTGRPTRRILLGGPPPQVHRPAPNHRTPPEQRS